MCLRISGYLIERSSAALSTHCRARNTFEDICATRWSSDVRRQRLAKRVLKSGGVELELLANDRGSGSSALRLRGLVWRE